MIETGSALLIVLAAISLLRFALGRTGLPTRKSRGGALQLRETCALSQRQRVCVVEVDGERYLIGASDAGLTLLSRLADAAEEATPEATAPGPSSTMTSATSHTSVEPRAKRRRGPRRWTGIGATSLPLGCLLLTFAGDAYAQAAGTGAISQLALPGLTGPEELSSTLEVVALLTLLSVAPSLLLMTTCFTRIVIVLAFLRQAIGIHQLPPSQVLVGLALFTTLFVMAPIGEEIRVNAYEPYVAQQIDVQTAATRAATPVRKFLFAHTREIDLDLFLELSRAGKPEDLASVPMTTLLPAYMISELRTAFEIGFMIYLPFLVIDLVIASMLISMGMIVLPPVVISLPFKLMLFVLMDGWNRIIGSLVTGLQ